MGIVGVSFGVGLGIVGLLACVPKERAQALTCWGFLVAGWLVTVMIAPKGAADVWVWPPLDAMFGVLAIRMGMRHRHRWLYILALLFLGQCAVHVAWGILNVFGPTDPGRLFRYYKAINGLLLCQMACVSFPGERHVATILCGNLWRVLGIGRHRGVAP